MINFKSENSQRVLIGLAGWALFMISVYQCQQNESRIKDIKNIIESRDENIKTFKDEANRWHSIATVTELQHHEAVKLAIESDTQLKNLTRQFSFVKKSLKNLEYLGTTRLASTYGIAPQVSKDTVYLIGNDTLKGKIVYGHDPKGYYKYQAFIQKNNISDIQIETYDTISTAITKYRKWLLGRRRYKQEIISRNPNTKIVYQKTILIK